MRRRETRIRAHGGLRGGSAPHRPKGRREQVGLPYEKIQKYMNFSTTIRPSAVTIGLVGPNLHVSMFTSLTTPKAPFLTLLNPGFIFGFLDKLSVSPSASASKSVKWAYKMWMTSLALSALSVFFAALIQDWARNYTELSRIPK